MATRLGNLGHSHPRCMWCEKRATWNTFEGVSVCDDHLDIDADNPHYRKGGAMISRLIEHLEQSLSAARTIAADLERPTDEWDGEAWERSHDEFSRAFLAAMDEAQREEMIPAVEVYG